MHSLKVSIELEVKVSENYDLGDAQILVKNEFSDLINKEMCIPESVKFIKNQVSPLENR